MPPTQLAAVRLNLEARPGEQTLRCALTPLKPMVNFAFRFEAGYDFSVPQTQYTAPGRGWSVLTAITPEHGQTTYLLDRTRFSEATKIGIDFHIRGAYSLGPGRYSVEAVLRDDRNRVCRKQWPVVVQPPLAARTIPIATPRDTVLPIASVIVPDLQGQNRADHPRATVLLNAAAFSIRRTVIRPYDRSILLGALTALLEQIPAASVRLVAFSLEQQREIFRTGNVTARDVARVADAIRALDETSVDVHLLQKPLGHVDFLAGLIRREFAEPDPADTVVFLGPTSRYGPAIPKGTLPALAEGGPKLFYVRYGLPRRTQGPADLFGSLMTDNGRRGVGGVATAEESAGGSGGRRGGRGEPDSGPGPLLLEGQSDIITAAMAKLGGRTLIIHTPADLAKAIRKIEGAKK